VDGWARSRDREAYMQHEDEREIAIKPASRHLNDIPTPPLHTMILIKTSIVQLRVHLEKGRTR
jgi:hypothetical protein